jgi:hypothetical protein
MRILHIVTGLAAGGPEPPGPTRETIRVNGRVYIATSYRHMTSPTQKG